MLQRYEISILHEESSIAELYPDREGSIIYVKDLENHIDNIKSSYIYISDLKKILLNNE